MSSVTTRIVHFGDDFGGRIDLLSASGFAVDACGRSLSKLNERLRHEVDAVLIDEDGSPDDVDIVSIVRSHKWVPLILFQGAGGRYDSLQFDTVIPAITPARDLLAVVSQTIATSRAFVAEYKSLIRQSAALRDQSRRARLKSESERTRARKLLSKSKQPPFDDR